MFGEWKRGQNQLFNLFLSEIMQKIKYSIGLYTMDKMSVPSSAGDSGRTDATTTSTQVTASLEIGEMKEGQVRRWD